MGIPLSITIVVPVLNEAPLIRESLAPLQALRARGHSVVVVDGGSVDATVAMCEGLVDDVRSCAPGRARQMNAGAQGQGGGVLLFLHADTRLPADADDRLRDFHGSGHSWGRFDVRLSGTALSFRLIERMMNWRSRISGIATGDQTIFIRRSLFEELGGFADIPLMEDIELCTRLRTRSRPFCISSPVVTSSRRWEEKGIWRTVVLMWWLRLAYWRGKPVSELVKQYR